MTGSHSSLPEATIALAAVTAVGVGGWALRHRRAPAVQRWAPPALSGERIGPLYARTGGSSDEAVILLHGLVSTGDIFGAPYDQLAATRRLVVPDLLGFGRSLNESRPEFPVEAHLDALDQLAHRAGLLDRRWTIGGHSMGSALALRWATRHLDRVDRVICWGAPIHPSPDAARSRIAGTAMARLFVLDTGWAERACALSCRHRTAAGWLTAALEPTLPVPIARAVSLHTWPAYRDSIRDLVIDTDWSQLLSDLSANGIGVDLLWGTDDGVADLHYTRALAARAPTAKIEIIEDAGHHLPITHADRCLARLIAASSQTPHRVTSSDVIATDRRTMGRGVDASDQPT